MASIRARPLKNGSTSYTATITRQVDGERYQETKTDSNKRLLEAWAKKREAEIDAAIAAGQPVKTREEVRATLGEAIDRYIAEERAGMGKTKAQVLRTIREEYDIADMQCDRIESRHIVAFADELWDRPNLKSGATVSNYLEHLAAVFRVASKAWGYPLNYAAAKDAREACKDLGHTARSQKRSRRPTLEELDKLMAHFLTKLEYYPGSIPMPKLIAFAIFSTRRNGETCRITWADFEPDDDSDETRVMVRDLKHPGDKKGNDTWCTLPDPCRAIIESMPKVDARIFPYNSKSVSTAFTRACQALGIEDLHMHDLRHEGTSVLF
ncbi:MAG: site-specific integrase, partial [Pseudooceanicola nanhaiensis]|uniref:site-specific integrase n=1 Tax=Pseudooceanicola nanhaiensis TaxID=375761 RepID=UPI0040594C7C